ncbi:MAG: VIT1/CCC1 transporter family protein [Candidatus Taylorbacteria bacterium]|nr:VIT1/CCC1 transporter family protein [Candidatus Taylorbacteria bacterium]
MKTFINSDSVRSFTFGVEDSLVSTVGLISGIAVAGVPRPTILLTGIILIFVEALSMSAGGLLSENSAKEFEERKSLPLRRSVASAIVMFFSYFVSGLVVLLPYVLFASSLALPVSIAVSLSALFVLGVANARLSSTSPLRKGMTTAVIGGLAILAGTALGAAIER